MNLVKTQLSATEIQTIVNAGMENYFVNLSDIERTGLRTMAEVWESFRRSKVFIKWT